MDAGRSHDDPPRLPVSQRLPADWREQAARRERQDLEDEILARDRLVASLCPRRIADGRHRLVDRHPPLFLHLDGELHVNESVHCDGVIPLVTGTRWRNVPCPVVEIDGDRYPPREGRVEPKARRKRLLYRRGRP